MLYNTRGETFKLVNNGNQVKLYHKAVNKWSTGWTYIGSYKDNSKAESAARSYAN